MVEMSQAQSLRNYLPYGLKWKLPTNQLLPSKKLHVGTTPRCCPCRKASKSLTPILRQDLTLVKRLVQSDLPSIMSATSAKISRVDGVVQGMSDDIVRLGGSIRSQSEQLSRVEELLRDGKQCE